MKLKTYSKSQIYIHVNTHDSLTGQDDIHRNIWDCQSSEDYKRREGWGYLCECEVGERRCETTVTTSQHQTWGSRGCPVPTTSDITKSILEQSQFTVESWEE